MTESSPMWTNFAPGSSRGPRNAHTVALQMVMERENQLKVAGRLRELRGQRPQPQMADLVGVTLRAYQHWEAGHGIAWANVEKLAEIHGVTTNWLLYGDEKPEGARSQLDRIETMTRELQESVDELLRRGLERELGDAAEAAPRAGGSAAKTAGSRRRA